jgi:hypothetical protein
MYKQKLVGVALLASLLLLNGCDAQEESEEIKDKT